MCKEELLRKIEEKKAIVGVVGMGYVGLPFAVEKAKVGFKTIGIEQNPVRAEKVNKADNYIGDVKDDELKDVVLNRNLLSVETDFSRVAEMDVIVICVPTPLTTNLTPELKYIVSVTENISKHLRRGQLVSLESTTYPETTEEVLVPILEKNSGLKVEEDFYVAFSPERVDPGNLRYTTKNTNKVVGGVGPNSLEVAMKFYTQTILNMVPVSSAKAAELVKVFENTYRAVNIALVNELTLLCDRMGINVWEVLDAAFTKPFGIQPFYPGPGVGGHCIPLDPHYLEWKAREYNFNTHFINLAGEMNRKMPEYVIDKTCRVLNNLGKAISKSRILVLGVSYKANLDDWRESPAIDVIKLLQKAGADVIYHDPYVSDFDDHHKGVAMKSVDLTEKTVLECDLVLITTNHTNIDYNWVAANAKHIFDTRNATKELTENRDKITLL